jgi:PKHD-type hydroxylase
MLLAVPNVLTPEQVAQCRAFLDSAEWVDGKVTAGELSAKTKNNNQIAEDNPQARKLGEMILAALERNGLFMSAALPLKVYPPLFNRYQVGQTFGTHIDNAVRQVRGTPHRIRTDLSATIFLSAPTEYDGGELTVEDTFGAHSVKLPAGHMVLYPAGSLHKVQPVTKGSRLAAFFWVQSMVRDDGERTLLFDLDTSIQKIRAQTNDSAVAVQLAGIYHNLLRRWADS